MTKRERQLAELFESALTLAKDAVRELEGAANLIIGLREDLQQASREKAELLRTGMDEGTRFVHAENKLLRSELNKHGAYFPDLLEPSDPAEIPEAARPKPKKLSLLDKALLKVLLLFRR